MCAGVLSRNLIDFVPRSARRVLVLQTESAPQSHGDEGGTASSFVFFNCLEDARDIEIGTTPVIDQDPPRLPFPESTFDVIVAADILPLFRSESGFLSEMHRLLRSGGFLFLSVANVQHFEYVLGLARGEWARTLQSRHGVPPVKFFTASSLASLFPPAGFSLLRLGSFEESAPEEFPLNEERCYVHGSITLGPLDDTAYQLFRVRRFFVLAQRVA
jgi:SAM-dependent methyltransferase